IPGLLGVAVLASLGSRDGHALSSTSLTNVDTSIPIKSTQLPPCFPNHKTSIGSPMSCNCVCDRAVSPACPCLRIRV
ncbi:hypothetical protein BC831DRAFT_485775, partial [Entophlyctis helioformis]